jgi:HPt (histidine-containing phosphotransfer) domain-containing protein
MTISKEERLAALFKSYRDHLPVRMHELESKWEELKRGWNPSCAAEFDRACHNIAGSAPTFELPEIGEAARAVEYDMKSLLNGEADFNSAMVNEIDVKMNALRSAMNNYLP